MNKKLQEIEQVKARVSQNHQRLCKAIKNTIKKTKEICKDLKKQGNAGADREARDLTLLVKWLKRNISESEFEAIQVQINLGL